MATVPVKFPRTYHLMDTGAATRDDLVLDVAEAEKLIQSEVVCEEKVDGSNLGLSLDEDWNVRAQKRSHWVTSASEAQFAKLDSWIDKHRASLCAVLGQDRILYGEWLFAKHTVVYDCLPDWFVAFDVFDKKKECFLSRSERDELLKNTSIYTVRCIAHRSFTSLDEIFQLMMNEQSAYSQNQPVEGIYIRSERSNQLVQRAKLVRPGFVQTVNTSGHWSKKNTIRNILRPDLWPSPREIYDSQDFTDNSLKAGFHWSLDEENGLMLRGVQDFFKAISSSSEVYGFTLMSFVEAAQLTPEVINDQLNLSGWMIILDDGQAEVLWPSGQDLRKSLGLPIRRLKVDLAITTTEEKKASNIFIPCSMSQEATKISFEEAGGGEECDLAVLLLLCQAYLSLSNGNGKVIGISVEDLCDIALRILKFPAVQTQNQAHQRMQAHRLNLLARCQGKAKQFQDAKHLAQEAIKVDPALPAAHHTLATAFYCNSQVKEALVEFLYLQTHLRSQDPQPNASCSNSSMQLLDKLAHQGLHKKSIDKAVSACTNHLGQQSQGEERVNEALSHENSGTMEGNHDQPRSYPRTPQLPFSPNIPGDDILMENSCAGILGKDVVITEKLDGGNCCIFRGKVYARSHAQETSRPWFTAVKSMAPLVALKVPNNIAIFGENMEAIHSIEYHGLKAPLYVFGALDCTSKTWLAWDDVEHLAARADLLTVPVLFQGKFKEAEVLRAWMEEKMVEHSSLSKTSPKEGFVVRVAGAFEDVEFSRYVGKYVRRNHVQTKDDFARTWRKSRWKAHT